MEGISRLLTESVIIVLHELIKFKAESQYIVQVSRTRFGYDIY